MTVVWSIFIMRSRHGNTYTKVMKSKLLCSRSIPRYLCQRVLEFWHNEYMGGDCGKVGWVITPVPHQGGSKQDTRSQNFADVIELMAQILFGKDAWNTRARAARCRILRVTRNLSLCYLSHKLWKFLYAFWRGDYDITRVPRDSNSYFELVSAVLSAIATRRSRSLDRPVLKHQLLTSSFFVDG